MFLMRFFRQDMSPSCALAPPDTLMLRGRGIYERAGIVIVIAPWNDAFEREKWG